MSGDPPGGGMSGGGTGLMSGGGLSMGSGGRGNVGFEGCSIMSADALQEQPPRNRRRLNTADRAPTRPVRSPASTPAHCCARRRPGADGSRTPSFRPRADPRMHVGGGPPSVAASSVRARSCVVTRPIAPRPTSARTMPFGADPPIVRIGAVQDLVEQEQQRHRPARRVDDGADAQNLGVEPRVPLPAASPRRAASRREPAPTARSRRARDRRAGERKHDVDADRAQERALARHVRSAQDHHARAGRAESRDRCAPRRLPESAGARAPTRRRSMRHLRRPAMLRKRIVRALVCVGRERRQRLDARRPRAASRPTAGPYDACQRAIATASCWRTSSTYAIGANSRLWVESSHDTSDRSRAIRFDGATPSVSSARCSASSRGDVNRCDSMRASSAGQQAEIAFRRVDRVQHVVEPAVRQIARRRRRHEQPQHEQVGGRRRPRRGRSRAPPSRAPAPRAPPARPRGNARAARPPTRRARRCARPATRTRAPPRPRGSRASAAVRPPRPGARAPRSSGAGPRASRRASSRRPRCAWCSAARTASRGRTDRDRGRRDDRRRTRAPSRPMPGPATARRSRPRTYTRSAARARSKRCSCSAWTTASTPNAIHAATGHAGEIDARTNAIHSSTAPAAGERRGGRSRSSRLRAIERGDPLAPRGEAPFVLVVWSQPVARRPQACAEQRARERDVVIRRGVQLGDRDVFVGGVRDVNRSGTEQQRLAPRRQERDVGRVGKHRGVEARHGRQPHRRHLEDVLDRDAAARAARPRARTSAASLDRAEHHFGLGRRRDDVRRHAAVDQPDGVMRAAEHRIGRQRRSTRSVDQRVDQLVDRRFAELRKRRVRGAAGRAQLQTEDAARRERRAGCRSARRRSGTGCVRGRRLVRDARAVAAALFADDEHAGRRASRRRGAADRRPRPARRGCPSRRTTRGRTADRPRRGSERTAARSRSGSRSTTPTASPTASRSR